MTDAAGRYVAEAILAIDTLWGGDVMCAAARGALLPTRGSATAFARAYTAASAAKVRASGGVCAKQIDHAAIAAYLKDVDVPAAIEGFKAEVLKVGALRGRYLAGLAVSLQAMWELALEMLGQGEKVPYERCVLASTGRSPEPSQPRAKRERVAELLAKAGHTSHDGPSLLAAVDAWRAARRDSDGERADVERGGHCLL